LADQQLQLYIDGGSRGNPGPAGVGGHLAEAETGRTVHEAGYFLGQMTNNAAEYEALLRGVELAKAFRPVGLAIFSDSELLVRQIEGVYRVKSPALKPLFKKTVQQLEQLSDWSIRHVKREFNQRADMLANQAMDAGEDVVIVDGTG
jgi:ribonuclease HI